MNDLDEYLDRRALLERPGQLKRLVWMANRRMVPGMQRRELVGSPNIVNAGFLIEMKLFIYHLFP